MNEKENANSAVAEPDKGKPIQMTPDTPAEYDEIKSAAEIEKRSLASFCLVASLEKARIINAANYLNATK